MLISIEKNDGSRALGPPAASWREPSAAVALASDYAGRFKVFVEKPT
jgi:hypothetical protein